ncbi:hypothetical protein SELMODRAFT_424398 [Selaginella moellendorffii]|uniref:DUF4408 domain-containing protein n=1 Tax=Selaginella moellendorffii TaxID=88036 RepID=D8SPR8_SELML|nr:hypothetical protein SELMODRAFT_424398 [Selaginella moellendorffii]
MASKPAAVATFTLLTALLPWIITFTPPLLRSLEVGFATEAWRLVVAWLTTPVLFVLVNFVILSIWATSSGGLAEGGGGGGALAGGAGDLLAVTTAAPPPPTKRKLETTQTLVFLPPVSVGKPDPQISVFSRIMPPPSSVKEIFDPEPVRESPPAAALEEKGGDDEVAAPGGAAPPPPAPAPSPIGILPPPLPSFLVAHREKLKKSSSAGTGATRKKKVVRTRSDKSGVVIKDLGFGDSREVPDDLTQRVESLIASVRAQLRQE